MKVHCAKSVLPVFVTGFNVIMKSLYHRMVLYTILMPLFYNPCLQELKGKMTESDKSFTDGAPNHQDALKKAIIKAIGIKPTFDQ